MLSCNTWDLALTISPTEALLLDRVAKHMSPTPPFLKQPRAPMGSITIGVRDECATGIVRWACIWLGPETTVLHHHHTTTSPVCSRWLPYQHSITLFAAPPATGDLFQPRTERQIGDRAFSVAALCVSKLMELPADRTETHAVVDSNIQAPSEVFSFRTAYWLCNAPLGWLLHILPLLLLLPLHNQACTRFHNGMYRCAPIPL